MATHARAEHSDQCRRYISLNFGHPECDCGCHSPWVLEAEAEVERLQASREEIKELYGNALDALSAAEDAARAEERQRCIRLVCDLCAKDWPREGDWHRHPKGEDMDGWSLECHAAAIHDASPPPAV